MPALAGLPTCKTCCPSGSASCRWAADEAPAAQPCGQPPAWQRSGGASPEVPQAVPGPHNNNPNPNPTPPPPSPPPPTPTLRLCVSSLFSFFCCIVQVVEQEADELVAKFGTPRRTAIITDGARRTVHSAACTARRAQRGARPGSPAASLPRAAWHGSPLMSCGSPSSCARLQLCSFLSLRVCSVVTAWHVPPSPPACLPAPLCSPPHPAPAPSLHRRRGGAAARGCDPQRPLPGGVQVGAALPEQQLMSCLINS